MDQPKQHIEMKASTRKIIPFLQKELNRTSEMAQKLIQEELLNFRFVKEELSSEKIEFVEKVTPLLTYDFHKRGRVISGPDFSSDCAVILLSGNAIIYVRKNQQELEQEKYWMNQLVKTQQQNDQKKLTQIQEVLNYYVKNSDVDLLKTFYRIQRNYFLQSSGICLYKKLCHFDEQEESTSKINSANSTLTTTPYFTPLIVAEDDCHVLYINKDQIVKLKESIKNKHKRIEEIILSTIGLSFNQNEKLNFYYFNEIDKLSKTNLLFIEKEKNDNNIYLVKEGSIDVFSGQFKLDTIKANGIVGYEHLGGQTNDITKRDYTALVSSDDTILYSINLQNLITYFPQLYSYLQKEAQTVVLKYFNEMQEQKKLQQRDFKRYQIEQQLLFGMNQESKANSTQTKANPDLIIKMDDIDSNRQLRSMKTKQDFEENSQFNHSEQRDKQFLQKKPSYYFQIKSNDQQLSNSTSQSPMKRQSKKSSVDFLINRKPADLTKIRQNISNNKTIEQKVVTIKADMELEQKQLMQQQSINNITSDSRVHLNKKITSSSILKDQLKDNDIYQLDSSENIQFTQAFQRIAKFQKKRQDLSQSQSQLNSKNQEEQQYSPLLTIKMPKEQNEDSKCGISQLSNSPNRRLVKNLSHYNSKLELISPQPYNFSKQNIISSEGCSPIQKTLSYADNFTFQVDSLQNKNKQALKLSSLQNFNDNSIDYHIEQNNDLKSNKIIIKNHKRVKSSQQLFEDNSEIFNIQQNKNSSQSPSKRIIIKSQHKDLSNSHTFQDLMNLQESISQNKHQRSTSTAISRKQIVEKLLQNTKSHTKINIIQKQVIQDSFIESSLRNSFQEQNSPEKKIKSLGEKEQINRLNNKIQQLKEKRNQQIEFDFSNTVTEDRQKRLQYRQQSNEDSNSFSENKLKNIIQTGKKNSLLNQIQQQEQSQKINKQMFKTNYIHF